MLLISSLEATWAAFEDRVGQLVWWQISLVEKLLVWVEGLVFLVLRLRQVLHGFGSGDKILDCHGFRQHGRCSPRCPDLGM